MRRIIYLLIIAVFVFAAACTSTKKIDGLVPYKPASQQLHDEIVRMDSLLFHAYNVCDTVTYASIFSEDLEFYHDNGGLETNKQKSVDAYKKYVCGKVTRELLKGSIEVSPVPNYGAVQIGMHRFHNSQEPNAFSKYSRFVIIWKKENNTWKVTRVISL